MIRHTGQPRRWVVPTVIKFAGDDENFILVQEDVNAVHDKLLSEAGVHSPSRSWMGRPSG